MPSQTPRYGFPYPVAGDPITDGAETIQDLAETVEQRIYSGGGGGGNGGGDPVPAPGIVAVHAPTSYSTQIVSGSDLGIVATVNINDPGMAYRLLPFGQFEAGHFNDATSKPVVYVRVGGVSGDEIGRGIGPNTSDWQSIAVTPTGTDTFAGTQTVYFVVASAIGGEEVRVSNYLAAATVMVAAV